MFIVLTYTSSWFSSFMEFLHWKEHEEEITYKYSLCQGRLNIPPKSMKFYKMYMDTS